MKKGMPQGSYQPSGQNYFPSMPGQGNVEYAPNGQNFQYSPPSVPPPAPASEAPPAFNGAPPQSMQLPPLAPPGQPGVNAGYLPNAMMASEGAPGIGSLQPVGSLQPAPPSEISGPSSSTRPPLGPPGTIVQPTEWQLPVLRD